nr:MAG TPA: hypothetical protein [Caudoviricetes sp.]
MPSNEYGLEEGQRSSWHNRIGRTRAARMFEWFLFAHF